MCGIAGYVSLRPQGIGRYPESVLYRMTGRIAHRGPDAEGVYLDAHAALGHRRLSIIDLSSAGAQPMTSESGRLQIVYNGEIFNHADLRPDLELAGHRYRSHCDTETILHAWEQYGPDCVQRFRGMFAFALWDPDARSLFCVRDRLGIKPFYYYWDGELFVFASEIKAILAHPSVSPRLEGDLLAEHLAFGYSSDSRTLFAGIHKLMPGHWLQLDEHNLRIERYWEIPAPPDKPEQRPDAEWIADCRQRLEETVRMRLMSDVPLGMFLSGGVDSSAIAALIRKLTGGPLETFSVGYREQEYSELSYAAQVAGVIGTDHHEVVVSMDDFFSALPRLIWHEDEPIVWPSSVSLYFVSQLAASRVKVVLTGEGADELFAGYSRYQIYMMNRRLSAPYRVLPHAMREGIRHWVQTTSLLTGSARRKLGHSFAGRADSFESLYLDNSFSAFSADEQRGLLRRPAGDAYASWLSYWNAAADRPLLDRLLYTDQKTYLVELLMKQDQMSMANSIESRVPFLDHTFVEFSTRVPDHLKQRGREGKYILKKAVEDLLPHDTVYRAKMGFPTPVRSWLRSPKASPLLARLQDSDGLLADWVDRGAVNALLERHHKGAEDATDRIWRLLNLQLWGDMFLAGKEHEELSAHCYEDSLG